MKEITLEVFPGLLKGEFRFPSLELETRSRVISLGKLRSLALHDASQELDPQSRTRALAMSGAIHMARSVLEDAAQRYPSTVTQTVRQELETFIANEASAWDLEVRKSIDRATQLAKDNQELIDAESMSRILGKIDLAEAERQKGFFDSAWERAESAQEVIRVELERQRLERERRRQDAYSLIETAEKLFLDKRGDLEDPSEEQTVVALLTRARAYCLEEDVDIGHIRQIAQVAQDILDGVQCSQREIQHLMGEPSKTTEEAIGEREAVEPEALEPKTAAEPRLVEPAIDSGIANALESLSDSQLRRLIAEALNPLGLVAPGSMVSKDSRLRDAFAEARRLYQDGDFERAYQSFLDLHNSLPLYARRDASPVSPALFNAAACALAADQYEAVIDILGSSRKALFGFPLWNLGVAYYGAGRVKDAMSVISQWTQRAKTSRVPTFYGYYTAALLSWMLGNQEEALESMRRAWAEDPTYVRTRLFTAPVERPLFGLPSGVEIDRDGFERVMQALDQILQPRPPDRYPQFSMADPTAQAAIGRAIERVGEGDASGALKQLLEIEAQGAAIAPLSWAIGACQLLLDDAQSAVSRLSQGSEHMPLPGSVWWNLTRARAEIGDIQGALHSIKQCIGKEFKTSPRAWLTRGLLAYACGEHDDARNSIRRSARFSETARTQVALALDSIGDRRLIEELPEPFARRVSEPIVRLVPEEPPELLQQFQETIRQAKQVRRGDFNQRSMLFADLAPQTVGSILEAQLSPFEIAFLDNLPPSTPAGILANTFLDAVRAYRDGHFIESADLLVRYIEGVDDPYVGLVNRGCALSQAGRLNDAATTLERATEIRAAPQSRYAWWNLAVVLWKREDSEGALKALSQERLCDAQNRFVLHNINLAMLAEEAGNQEMVATALYDACRLLESPSVSLHCYTMKACRDVSDWERVFALLGNYLFGKDLPEVIAGRTRPREAPEQCATLEDMEANFLRFLQQADRRAAVDFFGRVENLRLQTIRDEPASAEEKESAAYALLFHGFALMGYDQPFAAAECYEQALGLLDNSHDDIGSHRYGEICLRLAQEELRRHPVFALRVAEKGLEALPREARADTCAQDLLETQASALRRIPSAWLEGPHLTLNDLVEGLERPPDGASPKDLAQYALDVLAYATETLGGSSKLFKQILDLSQDITHAISTFEEQPFSARHERHAEIRSKLRQLALHVQLDMPDRGMLIFQEALQSFNDSAGALSKDVPAVDVGPLEDDAWFRGDELTALAQVRNKGVTPLQDFELKLTIPRRKELFWVPEPVKRLTALQPDDIQWIEWELVFNEAPQEDPDPLELSIEVSALVPHLATESYFERFKLVRLPQVFRDITVSYPAGALKPGQVEDLWGRARMLREMRRTITRTGQSRIYFLEGVRKVGKTSIMYFLAEEMAGDSLWAYVNFDTSWDNIYERISRGVRDSLKDQRLQLDVPSIDNADGFRAMIDDLLHQAGKKRLLLLFDEFGTAAHRLAETPAGASFLGDLRDVFNSFAGRIAVVLADFRLLKELQKTLPAQIWADVQRLTVSFLDPGSARDAVFGPMRGDERIYFEKEAIQRIIWYTGGYPWHLQQLCSRLIALIDQRCRYRVFAQDVDEEASRLIEEDHLFEEGLCRPGRIEEADRPILAALSRLTNADGLDRPVKTKEIAIELGLAEQEEGVRGRVSSLCDIGVLQSERQDYSLVRFSTPLLARWCRRQEQSGRLSPIVQPPMWSQPPPIQTGIGATRPDPGRAEPGEQFSSQLAAIAKGLRYQSRDITAIDIDAWLRQFADEQWRYLALKLLTRCRDRYYYDEARVRDKLRHLWQKAIDYLHTQANYQGMSERELLKQQVWFACLGKASKSEDAMLRLLRQECSIASERVMADWNEFLKERKELAPNTVVVVVDDFVGTGNNLVTKMRGRIGDAVRHFESLEGNSSWVEAWFQNSTVIALIAVGCQEGMEYIREQLEMECRLKLLVEDLLEDSDRAFHESCDLWLDEQEREQAYEMAETIGRHLYRPAPLGYGNGQYLVAFYHNMPNNTLPILHRRGRYLSSEWIPLFPSARR